MLKVDMATTINWRERERERERESKTHTKALLK
jgi:hypothetical protein